MPLPERLRAPDSSSGVWSSECGFESRSWHLLPKNGEVVLSALQARLRTDDTQAYIRMNCKRGNPVSALGVGGNGLLTKIIVAHTLKWPSSLVCVATCIKNNKKYRPVVVITINIHLSTLLSSHTSSILDTVAPSCFTVSNCWSSNSSCLSSFGYLLEVNYKNK